MSSSPLWPRWECLHCVSFPAVHTDNKHCAFHLRRGEGPIAGPRWNTECFIHPDHVGLNAGPALDHLALEWRKETDKSPLFCCVSGSFHRGHARLVDCQASLKPCSTFLHVLLDISIFVFAQHICSVLSFYLLLPLSVFSGSFSWPLFAANVLCDTLAKGCGQSTSKTEGSVERAENCPCWSLKWSCEIRYPWWYTSIAATEPPLSSLLRWPGIDRSPLGTWLASASAFW